MPGEAATQGSVTAVRFCHLLVLRASVYGSVPAPPDGRTAPAPPAGTGQPVS